ncbi:MAG: phosphoenolpyruvate--protein phosphotransferase, partial [Chloroflexi bacterium]
MTSTRPRLGGVAAAPGVARGPWAELASTLPAAGRVQASDVVRERERMQRAASQAATELRELATRLRDDGHADEAAIFRAHAAMARDPELLDAAAREIEMNLIDGVGAITAAARGLAERLAELEDELLRARAVDVVDVGDRIARQLAGVPTGPVLDRPSIVVAKDLPPSATASLPRERLLGIALEGSSPTAHASILARAFGIPAVVGVAGLLDAVRSAGPGTEVAIDGSTGEVVVDPDEVERARFERLSAGVRLGRARDLSEAALPAVTLDGQDVALLANIGSPDECEAAISLGAQGVGLFRTEFLFLERSDPPTEDAQASAYRRAVEAFDGGPVTIRLLDVGGDKVIPYLPMPREDNPFLGVRALRLAEGHAELFVTQLRACYRAAAAGPVRIMAPMVADAPDAALLLVLAERARDELRREGREAGT